TYRYWKIDSSATGVARIQGDHPTQLYPGDGSGIKRVDEPHFDVDSETNPYNVKYIETATMTELYDSGIDAVAGGHYSINSGEELKKLALYVKGNHATKDVTFYLTKDVDISVKAIGNDADGWLPIGCDYTVHDSQSLSYVFKGSFDGCGYTVYGLYIYDERGDNVGLFGRTKGATIKNLGVIGGVVGEFNCGGIVGRAEDTTITNCWANVSLQAESETGGIAGRIKDTTIENCVSYGATLCAGGETCISGGIAGDVLGKSAIKNCYYLKGTAQGGYNSAPSGAEINILTFTYGFEQDDYYCMLERATQIDDITTTSLLDALNAWVFLQNNGQYSGWRNSVTLIGEGDHSGHYPRLMTPGQFQDSDPNEKYDGDYTATASVSQLFSTGSDGIEGNAYSINGLDDLEALQKYVDAGRKTKGIIFFMTRDVDMSYKYHVDGNSWTPIGNVDNAFQGIYDGQGYTVKYIFIDTSADDQGLFGHVNKGATIKNLGICGIVRAGTNAGGIVGDFNFSTLANCWSSCEVTAGGNAGGLVGGANNGTIVNCTSYGAVVSSGAYGAIAGYAALTSIKYCYYLYGTCKQAYSPASTAVATGVQYFNGTSSACILHEKVNVEGTATQNALSALKLYVDAHPETNYCYWVIGNTEEYIKMGVALFPVLISASGTMGGKDFNEVQAYFNGTEYYSVIKAINAANDAEGGGDVILATNVVFYLHDDVTLDSDVRLVTDKYSAIIKSNIKLQSMQQFDGYFTVKDGGKIYLWDSAKNDYALFMYSQKKADPSCNSKIYGTTSLNFRSAPVVGDYPSAYNLSLEDGEFIINSTLKSGNPHTIPGGSTLSIQTHATLNVGANARIRTTGGAVVMNEGTVKIGNATLDRNGGTKMKGVFEDDGGTVTLPYIYKEGYTLRGWSDANGTIHVAGSRVKDVQPNSAFKAEWSLGESANDPYPGDDAFSDDTPVYNIPITVIQSNGGTISPDSMMAAKGENLSYQISADTGYQIKTVLVDGQPVELDENNCYHFISISRAHNIIALFAKTTNEAYYNWVNSFTDISANDWFYESVRYTASAQLFIGTEATVFSPDDAMTREMIVTVLWRLAGSPVVPDENKISFRDVSTDSYAYEAIRWASMFNIIEGYGDGTFGYGDPILREQLVTILFRFARSYVGVDVSLTDSTNILGYSDVLQISQGMAQPFQWAVGAKIIYGTSRTTLEPRGMATRAQVAAVFQRFSTIFMDKVPVFKT
ncbi:MAG: S-layer homology domain-containing protein, partial [Christensenellales bacterium]